MTNTAMLQVATSFHSDSKLDKIKQAIDEALYQDGIAILPPEEIETTLALMNLLGYQFDMTMLDPWYNKGFGGQQSNYLEFFLEQINQASRNSKHIYFWGFPEIIAPFVERIPSPLLLTCWLTWYYKNNPSVIKGWRSSQNACLHMSTPGAKLYPERFLNEKQKALKDNGKLRYMPGPTSVLESGPDDVIEQALLVGFIGRNEQTGHPSQKPVKVYDQLAQMTVSPEGICLDPMCGSGTLGEVAKNRGFKVILCDRSEEYTEKTEKRLGVKRISIK